MASFAQVDLGNASGRKASDLMRTDWQEFLD